MNPNPSSEQRRFLELDEICNQFEQSWQQDQQPSLAESLAQVAESDQQKLLGDLMLIDLRYRLERGKQLTMAQYQQQLPAHAEAISDVFVRLQEANDTLVNTHEEDLRDTTRIQGPSDQQASSFQPDLAEQPVQSNLDEIGSEFGDYELLEEIGRGGMGVVYRARQKSLDREVAVKMILAGGLADAEAIERFHAEAQAVAQLNHPNIVRVYEVGQHQGHHFFSMDYIQGQSLADVARDHPLSAREAADYVRTIAEAVHCAHEAGIIHRDLKPSNILTDSRAQPLITDFGLAKRTKDDSGLTATGNILGTPSYMPPEQVARGEETIGPASDVYALGAILYELLTGRPPFRAESSMETLLQVLQQQPVAPRLLAPQLHRDLETIVLKCLEKNPAQRYQTAEELAAELDRYWDGQPIEARPVTWMERGWRWSKRRPAVAGLLGLSTMAILTLIVGGLWYNGKLQRSLADTLEQRNIAQKQTALATTRESDAIKAQATAETERKRAVNAETTARASERQALRQAYDSDMLLAQRDWEDANIVRLQVLLDRHVADEQLKGFEWYYWNRLCHSELLTLTGHTSIVGSVSFSPDGKRIASGSHDRTVRIWDTTTGKEILTLMGHASLVRSVSFSPDGKRLVSCSEPGTTRTGKRGIVQTGHLKIWDTTSGKQLLAIDGHTGVVNCVVFSPDGERVASAGGTFRKGELILWDAVGGQKSLSLEGHTRRVRNVAFSPDGTRLVSTSDDRTIKLWDTESGQEIRTFQGHQGTVSSIAFSPDGKRLVGSVGVVGNTSPLYVWDATSGQRLLTLKGHSEPINSVIFSPDGKRIASGSGDRMIKIWDAEIGREIMTLKGHKDIVSSIDFSSDGEKITSASWDKTIKIWNCKRGQEMQTLSGHQGTVLSLAFSPDGQRIASTSHDNTIKLWDATSGNKIRTLALQLGEVSSVAFSPDGQQVINGSYTPGKGLQNTSLRTWDAASGQQLLVFEQRIPEIEAIAFSPAGQRLAATSSYNTIKIWNATNTDAVITLKGHQGTVSRIAFSPDGQRLATGSNDRTIRTWDISRGRELLTLKGHTGFVRSVAYSSDGKNIASGSNDNTIKIWNAESGREIQTLTGHTGGIYDVSFSPDGRRLASASWDKTIKIWNTSNGQEMITLRGHIGDVRCVTFSPDGKQVASGGTDKTVRIWDARPIKTERGN